VRHNRLQNILQHLLGLTPLSLNNISAVFAHVLGELVGARPGQIEGLFAENFIQLLVRVSPLREYLLVAQLIFDNADLEVENFSAELTHPYRF